jgi:cell division protease FtsH
MDYDTKKNRANNEPEKPLDRNQRPDQRDLLKKRRIPAGKPSGRPVWSFGQRMAFIFLMVLLAVFLWKQMNLQTADYAKVSYSEFDTLLNSGNLRKGVISEGTLRADLKNPMVINKTTGRPSKGIETQIGTYDHAFVQDLVTKGVEISIEPERTWINLLINTLPWILMLGLWLFFLRQMQGGPKGVFTFGKSKAKLMMETGQKMTFMDVAGVDEAKEELGEIIDFLKDPRRFQRLGGKIPKGALLIGPPGTGKTLLARAVAGEAGVPFYSMSGSDFVEMFVGVGASRVRDLFEQGKTNAPCIIFIDEIDAVGRQRGAGIGGGHDEREQTLNQLLVEMDGFESNEGVILLAATNRPDVLDPALLRPGRFDRQIVVDWPDVKARAAILRVHAKKIQIDPRVDLESVAKGTPGMTGADLANVVNEAALLAARMNRAKVTTPDFEEAKDKVMMGAARKSLVITEEEKRLTAYHEAGHVLVAKFVPGSDPVHKVSIVARGRALGLTHFLPQDERHNWSFNYCMGKLVVMLGGRAAEMVMFGDITNGAANDIERATDMARKMVCEWGMSKRLGPLTFGKKDSEIFLGREIATHKDYSEQTAVAIDQEIRKYVETAQQQAESIILEHTDKLEALAAEILKKEVLAGDEIDSILNNGRPPVKKQGPPPQDRRPRDRRRFDSQRQQEPVKQEPEKIEPAAEPPRDQRKPEQPKQEPKKPRPPKQEPKKQEPKKPETEPVAGAEEASAEKQVAPKSPRRRRGSRSRSRKQDAGGEKSPETKTSAPEGASGEEAGHADSRDSGSSERNAGESKQGNKDDRSSGGGDSSGSDGGKPREGGRKSSVFRERRTRMVNLKTGGRRRFIRKAPAQRIREIN